MQTTKRHGRATASVRESDGESEGGSGMSSDHLIGKVMDVQAPHAGHVVTVEKRDAIEKHHAYWLKCSCGKRTTVGENELPSLVRSGTIPNWMLR